MTSRRLHITALAALVGAAAYAFGGVIQITQPDPTGTHNTIDSTAEYLVTGPSPVALFGTVLAYLALGRMAGKPRAGSSPSCPGRPRPDVHRQRHQRRGRGLLQRRRPVCLLTWLVSSIVIAVGLRRRDAVPKPVAIALPLLVPITFALSPIGGGIITAAYWLTLATHVLRERAKPHASPPPAA